MDRSNKVFKGKRSVPDSKPDPTPESPPSLTWRPSALDARLPPYLALLQALEGDIRDGVLPYGQQLPPHRALALYLGLSLSTVTKAYREAGIRGSVTGRVGHGTFVARRSPAEAGRRAEEMLNLGVNVSPDIGQREALRAAMAATARAHGLDRAFAYDAHRGLLEHRTELANWIGTPGFRPSGEFMLATNGAQHGLDLALTILCRPGDAILVEELTYVGFNALANLHRYNLVPVAIDIEGLLPDALDQRLRETGARIVYAMPTLHSPTARTMSAARRQAIADVLVRHDATLIEDDVYAFLLNPRQEPIAGLVPDRTIYLASLSKVFELGFRAGIMVVPPSLLERAQLAMRATAWCATPLLFELGCTLIRSGVLKRLVDDLRHETRRRVGVFQKIFPDQALPHRGRLAGYHVWLDLKDGWTAQDLFFAARNEGILITPPGSAAANGETEQGVRLCLGACGADELERALRMLRQVIERPAGSMFSVA